MLVAKCGIIFSCTARAQFNHMCSWSIHKLQGLEFTFWCGAGGGGLLCNPGNLPSGWLKELAAHSGLQVIVSLSAPFWEGSKKADSVESTVSGLLSLISRMCYHEIHGLLPLADPVRLLGIRPLYQVICPMTSQQPLALFSNYLQELLDVVAAFLLCNIASPALGFHYFMSGRYLQDRIFSCTHWFKLLDILVVLNMLWGCLLSKHRMKVRKVYSLVTRTCL